MLYSAAKKVAEKGLTNVRLLVFDINNIENIFAEGEVDRFYVNFCDPWPNKRHAKRRLTHVGFLEKYRKLLKKSNTIDDWSAALTGLLMGISMPSGAPSAASSFTRAFVESITL